MKQILFFIAFLVLSMTATGQTNYADYAELWNDKTQQIRLEAAIVTVADALADQTAIAADSVYLDLAGSILTSTNIDGFKTRITRLGVSRKVNPNNLTDTQLVNGVRSLLLFEYWLRQYRSAAITKQEFFQNTQ